MERSQGWVVFAAIILFTAGIMRVFDAIWALRYKGALPDDLQDAVFGRSLNTYGWIYLIVGVVLVVSAVLLLGGSQIARWIGVATGVITAITAIWWMPYFPVWSVMYVGIGALVVYALAAHGGRAKEARSAGAPPPARESAPDAGPTVRPGSSSRVTS